MKKYYRCGWCGIPTDETGNPLSEKECDEWIEENAELVNGLCCANEQMEREHIIVTRDMAIDACDLSLEGEKW